MTKEPAIYRSLTQLWALATGVMVASLILSLGFFDTYLPDFAILMRANPVHFSLSILLTLSTILLFFAYIIATRYELDLLYDYLAGEIYMPRLRPKIYVITFGLAIVFGALIVLSRNLLAYSAVMVTYNLFDLWGSWEVAKTIRPPLDEKLHTAEDGTENTERLQAIWDYYFGNPTLHRIATMMFVNWAVVCLALVYSFTTIDVIRTAGYVILLLNIVIAEWVIYRWRRRSIYKLADPGWMSRHRQPGA